MPSGQRNETMASSMASRTCCPIPVRERAKRAAVMACAAVTAVSLSGTMVRTIRGRAPPPPPWIEGESGQRLDNGIVDPLVRVVAALSEPADRYVDQVGLDATEHVLAYAHSLDGSRAKVLNEHVRARHELLQQLATSLALQIEGDGALIAVRRQVDRRKPGAVSSKAPREVALLRRLDLDHVGALVAEEHGRGGPRDHRRDVYDADAFQWSSHGAPSPTFDVAPVGPHH